MQERRLFAGLERDSVKLEWLVGGRGEREREGLWPEWVGRLGMWIERDKRREAIPPDDQEASALAPCLRGLAVVASPAWEDPAAEFGAEAGEGPETLSQ